MKIYVMRHGLTGLNKKDLINGQIDESLAPEGIGQVNSVLTSLPKSIKHIYSSPLLRAKQTAQILAASLNISVSFHDELKETHFGPLTGKSWDEVEDGDTLRKKHRAVKYDYSPSGESADDVRRRVVKFLKELNGKKHADYEALVVTHGGIIRLISVLQYGTPFGEIKNVSVHEFDLGKILK